MRAMFLGLLWLVGACSVVETTRTGPTVPSRPSDCEVQVFTMAPTSGYEELAVIDVGSSYRSDIRDPTAFRDLIREDVCAVGGDAIYVHPKQGLVYSAATVLRSVATTTP